LEVSENKNFDDLVLIKENNKGYVVYDKEITKKKLKTFIKDIQNFVNNIGESYKKYHSMYELMLDTFYNNCSQYSFFIDSMVNHYLVGIKYKNKMISSDYKQPFFDLYSIKDLRLYIDIRTIKY